MSGNPHEKQHYDYMLAYSPYDNIQARVYLNILVTAGRYDSQVPYWYPAKWVARLRATKTDKNLLLLKANMDAGHSGASGRFDRHKLTALEHAFLLQLAGLGNEAFDRNPRQSHAEAQSALRCSKNV